MTNLVSAYQNNDIAEFEKLLRTNRYTCTYVCVLVCEREKEGKRERVLCKMQEVSILEDLSVHSVYVTTDALYQKSNYFHSVRINVVKLMVNIRTCTCTCMYACIVCMYMYMNVHVCMYVNERTCIY